MIRCICNLLEDDQIADNCFDYTNHRTGPFQPRPVTFHCHYSEPPSEVFGIDLRKIEETRKPTDPIVPPVLTFLLEHVKEASSRVSSHLEKRKIWLYETPLSLQHRLRSALQASASASSSSSNESTFSKELVSQFDLPIVASVIKLWLLELEIPLIVHSQYDELKHLYPKRVGAEVVEVPAKLLAEHLARMPNIHLEVLRTMISYFGDLIETTSTVDEGESDDVYLQKLSLSIARCFVRPRIETSLSIDDRFPSLLFSDLIKNRQVILSAADELKSLKSKDERYRPRRQRTRMIDTRLSRTSIGVGEAQSLGREESEELLKKHQRRVSSIVQQTETPPQRLEDKKDEGSIPQEAVSSQVESDESKEVFEEAKEEPEQSSARTPADAEVAESSQPQGAVVPSVTVDDDSLVIKGSPSLSRSTRTKGGRTGRPLSVVGASKTSQE